MCGCLQGTPRQTWNLDLHMCIFMKGHAVVLELYCRIEHKTIEDLIRKMFWPTSLIFAGQRVFFYYNVYIFFLLLICFILNTLHKKKEDNK